ncbi:MAG: alcohol dehydrogenase catalytic domain-containing protein [Candidatus Aramenus sp.]|jgi:NADPH:quinone reductase-like Zn-dependent oxidoreductase|nr:alcohol dehydrogenase catalytic domain-containing protein [Candidatus Aramenus sp.]
MQAIYFEKSGLENLKFGEFKEPEVGPHDVLVKVVMAGVNPIDYFVVNFIPVQPMPHVPGAEVAGVVEKVGEHVKRFQKGDRVVVYNRVFDATCDLCLSGKEQLCRNGGIMSVVTNGGFAEYVAVPDKNLVKLPESVSWEVAASLPVAGLTPFHALREANVGLGKTVVVFGASGNTGMMALQLAKMMGAKVVAVSSKPWVKEFADHVFSYSEVEEGVKKITDGRGADVVVNSVGGDLWAKSLSVLSPGGTMVFFGGLTAQKAEVELGSIYGREIKVVGTTGGTRYELEQLVKMPIKVKVWKEFKLNEGKEALGSLFGKERDGRIMLRVS